MEYCLKLVYSNLEAHGNIDGIHCLIIEYISSLVKGHSQKSGEGGAAVLFDIARIRKEVLEPLVVHVYRIGKGVLEILQHLI